VIIPSSEKPASPTPSSTGTPTYATASNTYARAQPAQAQPTATTDNTVIMALTSQITQLKKQHRQEVQALRTALEQAHGENPTLRRELTRRGWTGQPPS